jgi:hypothetical protein
VFEKQVVHLIEVSLQRLVLCLLLRKLSLGFGALVLDLLRFLGASVLGPLLASVLLDTEQEPDDDQSKRNNEQLQPAP